MGRKENLLKAIQLIESEGREATTYELMELCNLTAQQVRVSITRYNLPVKLINDFTRDELEIYRLYKRLTYKQIAEKLNVNVKTVGTKIIRMKKRMGSIKTKGQRLEEPIIKESEKTLYIEITDGEHKGKKGYIASQKSHYADVIIFEDRKKIKTKVSNYNFQEIRNAIKT